MASPLLHIKDSYYFEVPKRLWPVHFRDKSEFPDVWVRLDPQFQEWEAQRLYDAYLDFTTEPVPRETLLSGWHEWQHEPGNHGKPFDRFLAEYLTEHGDAGFLGGAGWERAKQGAGDIDAFHADRSVEWSDETIAAYNGHLSGKILIPQPFAELRNLYEVESGFAISKFMLIEVAVALLLWSAFSWLARQVESGERPRGRLWNLLEALVIFIRDEVARPSIGKHDADRFVPLLLTLFFFVLGCNLMGMIPWLGSPTGAWGATLGLAAITLGTVVVFGMLKFGPIGFFLNQIPSMDLPLALAIILKPMILAIEILGLTIKHAVLSVRLLANMLAGHMVLLGIMTLAFSVEGAASGLWPLTAFCAVVGSTLFSCLELFVAFLQAYIFTFLSALFIGAAIHHH
jgi:F-type H+-transporting ATPase subunit a